MSQLAYPLSLSLVGLVLSGLFFLRGWRRLGGTAFALAITFLWTCSTPLFSDWIRGSLEDDYLPKPMESVEAADAIVVLGGGVSPVKGRRRHLDLTQAADRVLHAARLFKANKAPFVLASGGYATDLLTEWGVPESAVIEETKSRNTYENAVEAKRILDKKGADDVLLVTSALHMRRALAVFGSAGIDATPAPTDFEVVPFDNPLVIRLLPDAEALEGTTRAIHEYLGYVVYQWRGWIKKAEKLKS